jgi:hypothetical protein
VTYAFSNSGIETITIPASVEWIGSNAFKGCQNIKTVIFEPGSKLESISKDAFEDSQKVKIMADCRDDNLKRVIESAGFNCEIFVPLSQSGQE